MAFFLVGICERGQFMMKGNVHDIGGGAIASTRRSADASTRRRVDALTRGQFMMKGNVHDIGGGARLYRIETSTYCVD